MIAGRLEIAGFSASHDWIRGFLKRFYICNVTMHVQEGAVNLMAAAAAVEGIRRRLEAFPPDRIYNMDETTLLFRCLPSRSYAPQMDRRRARGTNAMRDMDRVTLILCTNATGTHKLSVAMICEAIKPLCFLGDGNECPLPYFDQRRAWMDKIVYARWWTTVFLPAVREGHRDEKCTLNMDSSSTHDVELMADDVDILHLRPNTTVVYQPMDAGVIVALMRRYKRRLLAILIHSFPVPLDPPPPPDSPPRPPPPLPTSPSSTAPAARPCTPPPPPLGFRAENAALWVKPTANVLQEFGASRLAGLEVTDEEADAEAHVGLLPAVLPLPDQEPRPARNCGQAGNGQAHLLDAATLISEEWDKVTSESIVHCWVKSTILHVSMNASVVALHAEYRQGFQVWRIM